MSQIIMGVMFVGLGVAIAAVGVGFAALGIGSLLGVVGL